MLEEGFGEVYLELPVVDQGLAYQHTELSEMAQVVGYHVGALAWLDVEFVGAQLEQTEVGIEQLFCD